MMKSIVFAFGIIFASIATSDTGRAMAASRKAGQQYVYAYSSEGIAYSDMEKLYRGDSSAKAIPFFQRPYLEATHVDIRCKIKKTILSRGGDSMKVCFEIIQPDIKITSSTLPVNVNALLKEMTLPVFANMNISGNILSVKLDTAVSYATAGIVKNILSNTQVVIPSEKKKSWQVTEENTVGVFKATYEIVYKNTDSLEYQKTNSGYEKPKASEKGQKYLPDCKTTIITDTHGTVQRIHISESLVTLFGADTIVASGSTTVYKLLSATNLDQQTKLAFEQLEQSGSYLKATSLSAPLSDEDINRMAYKNTLADDNFETLTEKMKLVAVQDQQYESELVKKFRALAWLSEPDCAKMAALLRKATRGSDTFRIMSNALAAAETAFSIDQLAAVIAERRNEEAVMIRLLPVLATTTSPTSKAADIIKELAFAKTGNAFITSTAQLTLGGMVKNLSPTDRKKADELTDLIIENMKNSPDTLQQLLVYGNTGSYRLLPVYSSYINNPLVSVEIRKAAVFAMRLIDHKKVPPLLEQLSANKDTVISKAAKETIEFRNEYLYKNL